jgi:uncharacterized membrane protein
MRKIKITKPKKMPGFIPATAILLGIIFFASLWQDHSDMAEFPRDFIGYLLLVGVAFAVYQLKFLQTQKGVVKKYRVLSTIFSYIPLAIGGIAYFVWMSLSTHAAVAVLRSNGVVANARTSSHYYVYEQLFPGWLLGYRHTDDLAGAPGYEVVRYQLKDGASGILDIPIDDYLHPGRYANLRKQIDSGYIEIRYLPRFSQLALPNAEFTDPVTNPPY